jgi:hypothetical protein
MKVSINPLKILDLYKEYRKESILKSVHKNPHVVENLPKYLKNNEFIKKLIERNKSVYLLLPLELKKDKDIYEYLFKTNMFLDREYWFLPKHWFNIKGNKTDIEESCKVFLEKISNDLNVCIQEPEYLQYIKNSFCNEKKSLGLLIKKLEMNWDFNSKIEKEEKKIANEYFNRFVTNVAKLVPEGVFNDNKLLLEEYKSFQFEGYLNLLLEKREGLKKDKGLIKSILEENLLSNVNFKARFIETLDSKLKADKDIALLMIKTNPNFVVEIEPNLLNENIIKEGLFEELQGNRNCEQDFPKICNYLKEVVNGDEKKLTSLIVLSAIYIKKKLFFNIMNFFILESKEWVSYIKEVDVNDIKNKKAYDYIMELRSELGMLDKKEKELLPEGKIRVIRNVENLIVLDNEYMFDLMREKEAHILNKKMDFLGKNKSGIKQKAQLKF